MSLLERIGLKGKQPVQELNPTGWSLPMHVMMHLEDDSEPIPSLASHAEKTRQILEARKAELEATQAAVSNLQANAKDIEAEIAALVAADTVLAPYLPAKVEHPDTVRDEVTGPEHDPLDGATQEVAAFNGALMQGAAA
ncbi:MAG: hypothetical protein KGL39_51150 [Patescibacteria group bacterium]|nr:hypothetical protein [Patescibacteria group bacterium]